VVAALRSDPAWLYSLLNASDRYTNCTENEKLEVPPSVIFGIL
jgi:hypothetical protein